METKSLCDISFPDVQYNVVRYTKQKPSHHYLFGNEPGLKFAKQVQIKKINQNIYSYDTLRTIFHKIAIHCSNHITGESIYAWYKNKENKIVSLVLHNESMMPFQQKTHDEMFITSDGNKKYSLSKYISLDRHISEFEIPIHKNVKNIYIMTAQDFHSQFQKKQLSDNQYLYGIIQKYWPMIETIDDISNQDTSLTQDILQNKKKYETILNDFKDRLPCEIIDPVTMLYKNNTSDNFINLFKLFNEFSLTSQYPISKVTFDDYKQTKYKLYKSSILPQIHSCTTMNPLQDQIISQSVFEKSIKSKYMNNFLGQSSVIPFKNTFSVVVYNKSLTYSVLLIISNTGKSDILFETYNDNMTTDVILTMIEECNKIITMINKDTYYSELFTEIELINETPYMINCDLYFNIIDYKPDILRKIILYFYTQLSIFEQEKDEITVHYKQISDYENPKYIQSYITSLYKLKYSKTAIIDYIHNRFHITKDLCEQNYSDWLRIYEQKRLTRMKNEPGVSITIKRKKQKLACEVYGLHSYEELSRVSLLMKTIFGIYYQKVEHKKDPYSIFSSALTIEKESTLYSESLIVVPVITSEKVIPEVKEEEEDDSDEDDSEEDDSEEDDSDDEDFFMGKIDQEGGGYPAYRYYLNRLERYDYDLFNFNSGLEHITKSGTLKYSYPRICGGPKKPDRQPIAITDEELKQIDIDTGFKNEGITYSSARHIEGRDESIKYICPKFWDMKHERPLDPLQKKDFYEHVVKHDESVKTMKNTDNYILERSGRPEKGTAQEASWYQAGDDINNYQVSFIHDAHPDGYPLPCCSKKKYDNFKEKEDIEVLIETSESSKNWYQGICIQSETPETYIIYIDNLIKQNIQSFISKDIFNESFSKLLKYANQKGFKKYRDYLFKKLKANQKQKEYNQWLQPSYSFDESDIKHIKHYLQNITTAHASSMKQYKISQYILNSFPLGYNQNGHIDEDIKYLFNQDKDHPTATENGFLRKGIQQMNNSCLLAFLMILSKDHHISKNITYDDLISYISDDIMWLDLKYVMNGNFIQSFKNESYDSDITPITEFVSELPTYLKLMKQRKLILSNKIYDKFDSFILKKLANIKSETLIDVIHSFQPNIVWRFNYLYDDYTSRYNFKKYIISDECKYERYIYPIIESISQLKKSKIFQSCSIDEKLQIILFEESYNSVQIQEPIGGFQMNEEPSDYLFIYKQNHKYEPIFYKAGKKELVGIINRNEYKEQFLSIETFIKQKYISYKPIATLHEQITYNSLLEIIDTLQLTKTTTEYIDNYNRITHIVILYKKKYYNIPIKPEIIIDDPNITYEHCNRMKYAHTYDETIELLQLLQKHGYHYEIEKVLTSSTNVITHLLLQSGSYLLVNDTYNRKTHGRYYSNKDFLKIMYSFPMNYEPPSNELITYYELQQSIHYECNKLLYYTLKQSTNYDTFIKISYHPIMLLFHKRLQLYELVLQLIKEKQLIIIKNSENSDIQITSNQIIITLPLHTTNISKEKIAKYFIECVLRSTKTNLQKDILHSSTHKIVNTSNSSEYLLTYQQIIYQEYLSYFIQTSKYIRNISYYDTIINHREHKKQKQSLVSLYTKYPHQLNLFFGQTIRVIHNSYQELTDLHVIAGLFNDTDITHLSLKNKIITMIQENPELLSLYSSDYSLISYSSVDELITEINKDAYYISMTDLYLLSLKLQIGFCLYTNYYHIKQNKFQFELFIIIHEDLVHPFYLPNLPIYSLYQDIDIDNSQISNLQFIENNYRISVPIKELFHYPAFQKECKINYSTIYSILSH